MFKKIISFVVSSVFVLSMFNGVVYGADDWKTSYKSILTQLDSEDTFILLDIDGNGTPELIAEKHGSNGKNYDWHIYTFADNKLIDLTKSFDDAYKSSQPGSDLSGWIENKQYLIDYWQLMWTGKGIVIDDGMVNVGPFIIKDNAFVLARESDYIPLREIKRLKATATNINNALNYSPTMFIDIEIYINGEKQYLDVPPQIINGRTMVPLRAICEALGMTVAWNDKTNTATLTKGKDVIIHKVGETKITINGIAKDFDTASMIIDGRTLVPARMMAEAINASVDWDGDLAKVTIKTNK